MSHLTRMLLAVVATPMGLTACSDASSDRGATADAPSARAHVGSDGVQQVSIDTTNAFRFVPAVVHAHVGKLRILLADRGSYPHNISFPALHSTSPAVSGNPGQQQTTFTISLTHVGTYDFVCTFHSSAGMRGEIDVS